MFTITDISGKPECSDEIFKIEKECFPNEFWSYEIIKKNLEDPGNIFFGCFSDGQAVGYLNVHRVLDEAELERIGVITSHRGHGIGKRLMDELIYTLRNIGITKLMLEVRTRNQEAISLYTRYGFNVDSVRKNYYQNPSDDAFLMSLML